MSEDNTTPAANPSTPAESYAYIGRAACGCIRMATVDRPERARAVATEIAKAVRAGETVERVTCEFVRQTPWTVPGCADHEGPFAKTKKKVRSKQGALL